MSGISFFEPMVPPTTTHNDLEIRYKHQGGRRVPFIGKSDDLKRAEASWRAHLAKHRPEKPLSGAVYCEMRVCWPTDGGHAQGEPKTTVPDNDNVEKTVWDVLKSLGFVEDDAQIAHNRTMKMWADPAGIYLRLEEM